MRTRCGKVVLLSAGAAIAALGFSAFIHVTPRIVWNASKSAPIGFYRIDCRVPQMGEFALVKPSGDAAKLISARGYLPVYTPLIKRVSAQQGDEICRDNERVFVNGKHAADALRVDSMGRAMPRCSGCFTLQDDELFLLNAHEQSLDGRYFGATNIGDVIGVAIPVFVKE